MNYVIGTRCYFIQSSFGGQIWDDPETAWRKFPGKRLIAWVVANNIGFGIAAHHDADVVVELKGLLEDSETTEAGGSGKYNCAV